MIVLCRRSGWWWLSVRVNGTRKADSTFFVWKIIRAEIEMAVAVTGYDYSLCLSVVCQLILFFAYAQIRALTTFLRDLLLSIHGERSPGEYILVGG